jgi:hypothetical protein
VNLSAMPRLASGEPTPDGDCPRCRRLDVTHRVVIGNFELRVCRLCAEGFKRTPGVVIETLP